MLFNSFIWQNFKDSDIGKESISKFRSINIDVFAKYNEGYDLELDEVANILDDLMELPSNISMPSELLSYEDAKSILDKIAVEGIYFQGHTLVRKEEYYILFDLIPVLSIWLHLLYPDLFKPYFYRKNFKVFRKICDTFGIFLPEIPSKECYQDRFCYYLDICVSLWNFQDEHDLSDAEMCSFLYDFAPRVIQLDKEIDTLPQPSRAWFIGCSSKFADIIKDNSQDLFFWQCNQDTLAGDVMVMYARTPKSCIHSAWIATTDAIIDPFFYYYCYSQISAPIILHPVTLNNLKTHIHFSNNRLVKKNMQGINGWPITSIDYLELGKLMPDNITLPKIYKPKERNHIDITCEKDVEEKILEPLLIELGYDVFDWTRQLPVRMGRGERNYPDYCLFANDTKGYERSVALIEVKHHIRNNRDLEEAYVQARSYALRLESLIFVLCDEESIFIFKKSGKGFNRHEYLRFRWDEISNGDQYAVLHKTLSKKQILKEL